MVITPCYFSLSLSGWMKMKHQVFDCVCSSWVKGSFPFLWTFLPVSSWGWIKWCTKKTAKFFVRNCFLSWWENMFKFHGWKFGWDRSLAVHWWIWFWSTDGVTGVLSTASRGHSAGPLNTPINESSCSINFCCCLLIWCKYLTISVDDAMQQSMEQLEYR